MGLNPDYVLHHLTLDEYVLIYDGWLLKYQNEWDHTRMICFNIFNGSMNRVKAQSMRQFMPFPWDAKESKPEVRQSTREEFEALKSLIQQIKN